MRAAALPGLREPWDEAAAAARPGAGLHAGHRVRVAAAAGSPLAYPGLAHADLGQAELLHPYVAPGFQGRGIGGRLPAEAIAAAPGGLALHAFARNHAARRCYQRHGFRIADRRKASANEEGEPDIRYVLVPRTEPNLTEEREP